MAKLAHLLVLSCLIIFLAFSGCIGNDASKLKEENGSNYTGESNALSNSSSSSAPEDDLEVGLTQSDLKELDSDMSDLQGLRSEERRVGKECPTKCRSRWSPYH
jgi:hypothetical protein